MGDDFVEVQSKMCVASSSNSMDSMTVTNRPRHKRNLEKDFIRPSAPSKRPKFNLDDSLFGNTDDIDDDLLDLEGEAPTSSKRSTRAVPAYVAPPPVVSYRRVLRHVPNVPYVPLTTSDGARVYLRLLPEKNTINLQDEVVADCRVALPPIPYKGLLGIEFQALRREAEKIKDRFKKIFPSVVPPGENITNDERGVPEGMENMDLESGVSQDTITKRKKTESQSESKLWVEKYKPKGYMDLLSEETINHGLLHWMKLWDNCVFGTDYLAKHKEFKEKYAKLEAQENENSKYKDVQVQDDAYDELGRPKQKVVLLHGAAGLGKTTAAHVVAKHSGYKVIELNASDDRSVEIFRKVLDSTTESRSEMFQDGRPTCLVIDEIDGSPLATVDVLVNLVSGKAKEAGKNKKKKTLRRPVICICNDLYAPSLKNLRLIALILHFQPIEMSYLVERIEEISLKEDLRLDNTTLQSIAEKSECDIRSCLSTMQFIKQRDGKFSLKLLSKLGTKDKIKGIFSVWEDIFYMPKSNKYYDIIDPTRPDIRFQNVLRTVQNFGDYEKLHEGVFENYLKTKFRDAYFETILNGLEWSIWFSEIHESINSMQNYSLFGLLPMYFIASHFLYAGAVRFPLQYPNNTVYTQSTRFMTNFTAQLTDISPSVGRFVNMNDAILDIFPLMLSIVQPATIRPIPSQLWSPRERECLKNIVDIMIGYNITYTQQRTPEGTYTFVMDPNIEELARFPSADLANRKQFLYAIKQMISREIEIEKMRQEEPKANAIVVEPVLNANDEAVLKRNDEALSKTNVKTVPQPQATVKSIPNWKQPIYKFDKEKSIKPIVAKDFFGRPITPKPISPEQAKLLALKAKISDIWYRYKEGYSNAVRKKVKVKDFL